MSFGFHVRTSFESLRREPFQAFTAISVLVVTFFVTTFLALLVYGTNQVVIYFETRPQVIAFLNDEATVEEVDALRADLEGDERVGEVAFVSKEQALDIYRGATADNPLLGELVSPSIFPASIEFSVTDLEFAQALVDEVGESAAVESVGFTASLDSGSSLSGVIERLKTIAFYVRVGGVVSVVVLALNSFLVLTVVIGMRVTMRRGEIESLYYIGATKGFIRFPVILEAINYAVVGVIFGWLFASVLVLYSTPLILDYFGDIAVLPSETLPFFWTFIGYFGG